MGCDIHVVLQNHNSQGQWMDVPGHEFWDGRCYALFAWLAGVRNYSGVKPLSEPRGLPDDFKGEKLQGLHSESWFSIEELCAVDYDQIVEDRRVTINGDGGCTCPQGQGARQTLREFLSPGYVDDIFRARDNGIERVVFGFDS